jgi:Lrp/AsnC family transcriptional regulator for asnA, asnC and gidA
MTVRRGGITVRGQSLDRIDIAIITRLQQDGRTPYTTIAKALGISEASVRQRVARLISRKVIQIVAVSSPLDLGLLWSQIHLRVAGGPRARLADGAEPAARLPEVDYVSLCAGSFDIIVGVVSRDRQQLQDLLVHRIRPIPGIERAEHLLILKVLKDNYEWSPGEESPA